MRRKWMRYLSCLCVLLFAAGIGLSAKSYTVSAEGGADGLGIFYIPKNPEAELGTERNPFTILEIVPNRSMGMIGYMIPGCEPVDMEALEADEILRSDFQIDMIDSGIFRLGEDGHSYENTDCLVPVAFDGASSYEGFVSQVITVTPDELTGENLRIIRDTDMIVITAQDYCVKYWEKYNLRQETLTEQERGTTTFLGPEGNDLSWDATLAIVERMASEHPAAMLLQFPVMCGSGNYNMEKLYIMLMQYGAKAFKAGFLDDNEHFQAQEVTVDGRTFLTGAYWNEEQGSDNFKTTWDAETFKTKWGVSVMHESAFPQGQNEVFGTILTYNGNMDGFRDFLKTDRITEITTTGNEYYKPGTNSELFDYYEEGGSRPQSLSMNQGVRYILQNAGGKLGYKKELNVLEVSPCSEFIYGSDGWEIYYMSLFPWFTGDLNEALTVTTMATYQLIGDITDLNGAYDLILFGAEQDASNGLYGYNDSSMNQGEWLNGQRKGLIYTGIGDLVTTDSSQWSWNTSAGSDRGSDAWQLKARYSGNDLTKKKYEELRDFLMAGKPIVMAAELYSGNRINGDRVDTDSYLCQLGNLVYTEGVNQSTLFKEGSYRDSAGRDRLRMALARETCRLIFPEDGSGLPTAYQTQVADGAAYIKDAAGNIRDTVPISGVISSEQYNELRDASGNPVLRYEFTLDGDVGAVYGVRIFIDRNGDGIYAGSIKELKEIQAAGETVTSVEKEEAADMEIVDMTEGAGYGVQECNLLAGHTYVITCPVPGFDRGILPWKLEVYQKDNDSIRCSRTGYTAVRAADGEKVKIRVLQMDLMPDMRQNGDVSVNFADQSTVNGAKLAAYLAAVPDFSVQISYMENSDWYQEYGEEGEYARSTGATKAELLEKWMTYLEDVDMLMIGYQDMASFTDDEVFYEGFLNFVREGKSVILSHDLVKDAASQYREPGTVTGHDVEIRTLAGQRRKYYVPGTSYYRYSGMNRMGGSLDLVLKGEEADRFRFWTDSYPQGMPYALFTSGAKTNIPAGMGGLTTEQTGTYEEDGETFLMDTASEFMDNSVRLLLTYGKEADRRDRVLREEQTLSWTEGAAANWIRIANDGQITNYPYVLGDTIQISTTHAQNFQLDLEQEDGGDVTVWYNLTDAHDTAVAGEGGTNDGVYSSRSGDSRNNYYIYTKGNITYTGLGHSRTEALTDDEVKLFVNTMISAYRAAPEKPYVKVTNEDASVHENTYTMYVMLTGAEKSTDELTVNFTVCGDQITDDAGRQYYLQYQGADGQALARQPETAVTDGTSAPERDDGRNCYVVFRGGNYSFQVPYREVLEHGEAVYYLELRSEYTSGTKTIETRKVTKVVVYAMSLFTLH